MKTVPLELIKELRNLSSASVADCRQVLQESAGDINKAMDLLRKRGLEAVSKKEGRVTKEGRVEAYLHNGNKIGVLLEVKCETDFVARNSDFCQFTRDVAMQIAALNPKYIKKEDAPAEALEKEKNKELFIKEHCLMEQAFIKDASLTINDYLGSLVAKFNEKIVINRFTRYKIGE